MPSEVQLKFDALASFTISIASLTSGSGRQSTILANSDNRPGAIVYVAIKSGSIAPATGETYDIYLLRGDGTGYISDGAGSTDAAITIENAQLLGQIAVSNTANKIFYGEWDTAELGPIGSNWGIAIVNSTAQTISTTESDHYKKYRYYVPEVQ